MTTLDLLNIIRTNEFIIYGNGYIAKRLLEQLKRRGYDSHVKAIAISNVLQSNTGIAGKPLIPINMVNKSSLVLIAAHDEIAKEMQNTLRKLKIENAIHVYPYLFEIELGEPIEENIYVEVSKIIKCLRHGCMPEIYYLTLKDFCGKNIYNGSLYRRMAMHFMAEHTAEMRWQKFKETIIRCKNDGFKQDYNIKICKDFSLLDGLHRLMLARFWGIEQLLVDIYDFEGDYYSDNNNGMNVCLQKSDLARYYTANEIKAIEDTALELYYSKRHK